jgi:predicted porin
MLPRLHLFIVFCLSPVLALAEVAGDAADKVDMPVNAAKRLEQEQQETRRQVVSEGEDPQAQTTIERQVEAEEQIQQEYEKKEAPVDGEQLEKVREAVQAEEDEPRPEREKEVQKVVFKPSLEGKIYGSIRLHYRSTDQGSIFGDAGSRLGAEGGWRTRPDAWLYARIEAGFNVLDELDQLLSPGGSSGEGEQGDSVFPRLYTIGIETPSLVASIGKNWSTYYRVANFTDRFDSAGSDGLGTFNANTDGGATGTGRADGVFQSRAYMDFLPETWNVEPFNLNVQLQSGQPIPGVEGVKYQNAIGLSTVLELSDDFTFGIAYNRAQIEDLDNPAVQAAGIKGDAKALLFGARWFDEQWYLAFTMARLENHETTDKGTYFLGWGSELYVRYRLITNYWFVTGYNWLSPDKDQTQAGQFELLYGVVGLRYSIDDFKRLAYAEWRLDSTISEDGEALGNIFTIGLRWGF